MDSSHSDTTLHHLQHDATSSFLDVNVHDEHSSTRSTSSTSIENSHVLERARFPTASTAIVNGGPMPDPNGLGWPGEISFLFLAYVFNSTLCNSAIAKSTVSRLNSTLAERATREQKLCAAVRTILECIGEDPDREGLISTPQRYAQTLLWMTRGYEERLTGAPQIIILIIVPHPTFLSQMSLIMPYSPRTMTKWSSSGTLKYPAYVNITLCRSPEKYVIRNAVPRKIQ